MVLFCDFFVIVIGIFLTSTILCGIGVIIVKNNLVQQLYYSDREENENKNQKALKKLFKTLFSINIEF